MEFSFENQRILVTGAGRGIGREVCKFFANEGKATVIALSQTKENLDSLCAECPSIQAICVDLKNWDETRAAIESVLPLDGLVNNAGRLHITPFLDITQEEYDDMNDVNVKAILNVSQVVARRMVKDGKGGSIVNISSDASLKAYPGYAAYATTKSAVDMLSKSMALELGPFNIRVNCVNPTVVLTEMGQKVVADPVEEAALRNRLPLRKWAETSDVNYAIAFLLSDKSKMTTGLSLLVDGGFVIS